MERDRQDHWAFVEVGSSEAARPIRPRSAVDHAMPCASETDEAG